MNYKELTQELDFNYLTLNERRVASYSYYEGMLEAILQMQNNLKELHKKVLIEQECNVEK